MHEIAKHITVKSQVHSMSSLIRQFSPAINNYTSDAQRYVNNLHINLFKRISGSPSRMSPEFQPRIAPTGISSRRTSIHHIKNVHAEEKK